MADQPIDTRQIMDIVDVVTRQGVNKTTRPDIYGIVQKHIAFEPIFLSIVRGEQVTMDMLETATSAEGLGRKEGISIFLHILYGLKRDEEDEAQETKEIARPAHEEAVEREEFDGVPVRRIGPHTSLRKRAGTQASSTENGEPRGLDVTIAGIHQFLKEPGEQPQVTMERLIRGNVRMADLMATINPKLEEADIRKLSFKDAPALREHFPDAASHWSKTQVSSNGRQPHRKTQQAPPTIQLPKYTWTDAVPLIRGVAETDVLHDALSSVRSSFDNDNGQAAEYFIAGGVIGCQRWLARMIEIQLDHDGHYTNWMDKARTVACFFDVDPDTDEADEFFGRLVAEQRRIGRTDFITLLGKITSAAGMHSFDDAEIQQLVEKYKTDEG